jgi:hypothetical protein
MLPLLVAADCRRGGDRPLTFGRLKLPKDRRDKDPGLQSDWSSSSRIIDPLEAIGWGEVVRVGARPRLVIPVGVGNPGETGPARMAPMAGDSSKVLESSPRASGSRRGRLRELPPSADFDRRVGLIVS